MGTQDTMIQVTTSPYVNPAMTPRAPENTDFRSNENSNRLDYNCYSAGTPFSRLHQLVTVGYRGASADIDWSYCYCIVQARIDWIVSWFENQNREHTQPPLTGGGGSKV